jgi:glycosyltransferase involved in cell wall biosynthesis
MSRRRVLYVVASDWYFCCHRLSLAKSAVRAGYEVYVATPEGRFRGTIEAAGLRYRPIHIDRHGRNPRADASTLAELIRLYASVHPDLVHHVALKPIVYGSLAARLTRVRAIVNAMPGVGYVFLSRDGLSRVLRPAVRAAFRILINAANTRIILQNDDDREMWVASGAMRRERIVVIRGAGVDTTVFHPTPEPSGPLLVVLPARLLYDKGVREFVDAAKMLRGRHPAARFALVGDGDPGNPSSVPDEDIRAWVRGGIIESFGWRDDMATILAQSNIVCLPSYGEGMPKALLEAAASGRPIVATDVPGCRDVVRDGDNGLLVAPRDAASLAHAIERLLLDPKLRARMGAVGRARVLREFSSEIIEEATLQLYADLLRLRGRADGIV